jgi:uncharacterized membrane protein
MPTVLSKLRSLDQQRPGFPGEHWIVAAAGTSLLRSAFRRSTKAGRVLSLLAAAALLYRAASGRDGLAAIRRR